MKLPFEQLLLRFMERTEESDTYRSANDKLASLLVRLFYALRSSDMELRAVMDDVEMNESEVLENNAILFREIYRALEEKE